MARKSAAAVAEPLVTTSPTASNPPPHPSPDTDTAGARNEESDPLRDNEEVLVASKREKIRIVKNVVVLGVAFMLNFTAFFGTANLQSSVNSKDSLGTFAMASVYGSLILSNIFLPAIVIRCVSLYFFLLILIRLGSRESFSLQDTFNSSVIKG